MEEKAGRKVKVGLRVNEFLHRNVKVEAARRGISVERAYELALEKWAEPTTASESQGGQMQIPESMRDFVEFLVDWFSIQGSAEEELAKITIRQLAGQRAADLRRDPNKERTAAPITEFPQQKQGEHTPAELPDKKRASNGG